MDPDFETLYSDEPGKVRANANLPGHLILPITRLTMHSALLIKFRSAIEVANPGYDADHDHEPACSTRRTVRGVESACRKWRWKDWGIPEDYNPVHEFVTPYLQTSRSEAMKGSEQVVRSFQGIRERELEGVGLTPDLAPRATPSATTVIHLNGHVREAKKTTGLAKRMIGLGRKE